jgi:hypothetical protein
MLFFAYFLLALLLSLRSLILLFAGKNRFFAALCTLFFLVLALPFSSAAVSDLTHQFKIKIALFVFFAIPIGYSLWQQLRSSQDKKTALIWKKLLFSSLFFALGMALFGIHSIENFSIEKPILQVHLTGKSESREVEWKSPHQKSVQRSALAAHEVILQTTDKTELFHSFIPGELCAIRAKIFRFHPLLNALGISNKYRLDLIYTGYRSAQKYAEFPVQAYPIAFPLSFFNTLVFKYWESFFSLKANSFWIKSATLESNYFPMSDENGNPFEGTFLLTISNSGLSAIACSD